MGLLRLLVLLVILVVEVLLYGHGSHDEGYYYSSLYSL